jgi:Tol biopolymer transport system component
LFKIIRRNLAAPIGLAALLASVLFPSAAFATAPAVTRGISRSSFLAFPGANGKIVFDDDRDFHIGDIYVVDAGGTRPRNLTNSPDQREAYPTWSPEGRRIAFVSCSKGSRSTDIFIMNPVATTLTQITKTDDDWEWQPAWSPDGQRIAFARGNPLDRSRNGIWVMNADGSDPVQLTHGPDDGRPKWSPDGRRIAFGGGSQIDIYVMNADGSDVVNITNDPGYDYLGSWAPDGSKIIFSSSRRGEDYELYVMNPDGSGLEKVTDNDVEDFAPAWSPDQTRVAFEHNFRELWTMNPDGSDQRHILSWSQPVNNLDWQPIL